MILNSENIKKLSYGNIQDDNSERSSSVIDPDEDLTIIENNLQENNQLDASQDKVETVSESLIIVNKILSEIDEELDSKIFNKVEEQKDETMRKKSISFSMTVNEIAKSDESEVSVEAEDNDEAIMDDIVSISSENTVTDNIPTIAASEVHPDVKAQRDKIERKANILLENIGRVSKQKYFDNRDGRKEDDVRVRKPAQEKTMSKFEQNSQYCYPDVTNICRSESWFFCYVCVSL